MGCDCTGDKGDTGEPGVDERDETDPGEGTCCCKEDCSGPIVACCGTEGELCRI